MPTCVPCCYSEHDGSEHDGLCYGVRAKPFAGRGGGWSPKSLAESCMTGPLLKLGGLVSCISYTGCHATAKPVACFSCGCGHTSTHWLPCCASLVSRLPHGQGSAGSVTWSQACKPVGGLAGSTNKAERPATRTAAQRPAVGQHWAHGLCCKSTIAYVGDSGRSRGYQRLSSNRQIWTASY